MVFSLVHDIKVTKNQKSPEFIANSISTCCSHGIIPNDSKYSRRHLNAPNPMQRITVFYNILPACVTGLIQFNLFSFFIQLGKFLYYNLRWHMWIATEA
jgi:hypothetical protein